MENFFYNRHNSRVALVANGRHFENLTTNGDRLNLSVFFREPFVDFDVTRMRLLADEQAASFNGFFSDAEFLSKYRELRCVRCFGRQLFWFCRERKLSPPVVWFIHDGSSDIHRQYVRLS